MPEQSELCSVFLQEKHPPASLLLLLRKKSRSLRSYPCVSGRYATASPPTFCGMRLRRKYIYFVPITHGSPLNANDFRGFGWAVWRRICRSGGGSRDAMVDRSDRRGAVGSACVLRRQQSKSNGQVLSLGGGVTRSLLLLLVSLYFDSNVFGGAIPLFFV